MPASPAPWRRAAQNLIARGARAPFAQPLEHVRSRAAAETLDHFSSRADALADGLQSGDEGARSAYLALGSIALDFMRQRVAETADATLSTHWAAKLDALWRETDESEYLDDASVDEHLRVRILSRLDDLNGFMGAYNFFFERLVPLAAPDRPTRVLDLAAGHGGFALALVKLARQQGLDLRVTASDIKAEYLELGRRQAELESLDVELALQDALDLRNLEPNIYDVITCTQSLHHFSPGQVALMFSEASRVAGRGVLFIDGARSAINAAMVTSIGFLLYRDTAFAHDTLVSFRRFFVLEELEMLARLCPWARAARAAFCPPGHCVLELRR